MLTSLILGPIYPTSLPLQQPRTVEAHRVQLAISHLFPFFRVLGWNSTSVWVYHFLVFLLSRNNPGRQRGAQLQGAHPCIWPARDLHLREPAAREQETGDGVDV